MKLNNKKGFTLIELLAVIVILAILLAIAIPSVSKYISNAKKSTYIVNVKEYANAAQKELNLVDSVYNAPVNNGESILITFASLKNTLENGGKTSPYGGEFDENHSYILVVNEGTAAKPKYGYYIAARDTKGYAIGVEGVAKVIKSDDLKEANVVQVSGAGVDQNAAVSNLEGAPAGVQAPTNVYTSTTTPDE